MGERAYRWSFAELVDRLSIVVQKIVYAESEEMRNSFVQERNDIVHDLDLFLKEGVAIDGEMISRICYLQLVNATIWANETAGRGEGSAANYEFTHGLNANRATIKKAISQKANGRVDHKLNYISGAWDLRL